MTRLFALLVVLAIAAPASANCTPGMLDLRRAWPADRSVGAPTNTHVLVHLYGSDEYLAQRLALELRGSSGELVPLAIVADVRSGSSAMQQRSVVLRPARALAPRTRYELHDAGPPPTHGVYDHAFTTGDGPDASAPSAVAVIAGSYSRVEFGCGPAEEIPLGVRATDDAEVVWVRLRIARSDEDLRAGRFVGETILPVDEEGRASFGHGMCIGSWPLRRGERLVAAASVLDGAMHEVAAGTIVLDAR